MPLTRGKGSEKANFLELSLGSVGATRHKAIRTIMRRRKVGYEKARRIQAMAIAKSMK